jgi:hypothetical protein
MILVGFQKGHGTTTTFWRCRPVETQIYSVGLTFELAGWRLTMFIPDRSQFSSKVQGRSNDLGRFSKLVIGDNHILEMSASSECGNIQDEKLPWRVGRQLCMGWHHAAQLSAAQCSSVPPGTAKRGPAPLSADQHRSVPLSADQRRPGEWTESGWAIVWGGQMGRSCDSTHLSTAAPHRGQMCRIAAVHILTEMRLKRRLISL